MQLIFIDELVNLLDKENICFELYKCQKEFKENLHLLPVFLFNIAKKLAQTETQFLFRALQHNLMPKSDRNKIIGPQFASKASNKKFKPSKAINIQFFNPNLFIPKAISDSPIEIPNDLDAILDTINKREYPKHILLFKSDFLFPLEVFKKAIELAKKMEMFEVFSAGKLARSPLQIALHELYFEHALLLVEHGAKLDYEDSSGKSVREYFEEAVKQNKKLAKAEQKNIPKKLADKLYSLPKKIKQKPEPKPVKSKKENNNNAVNNQNEETSTNIDKFDLTILSNDTKDKLFQRYQPFYEKIFTGNTVEYYETREEILNNLENFKNSEVPTEVNLYLYFYFTYNFAEAVIEDANKSKALDPNVVDAVIYHVFNLITYHPKNIVEEKVAHSLRSNLIDLFEKSLINQTHPLAESYKQRDEEEKLISEMQKEDNPKNREKIKFDNFFITQLNNFQKLKSQSNLKPDNSVESEEEPEQQTNFSNHTTS